MLWTNKPEDIEERLSAMIPWRAEILCFIRDRMGAELTYKKRGKKTIWHAAFQDSGGTWNVYECPQKNLDAHFILEIIAAEGFDRSGELAGDIADAIWQHAERLFPPISDR